MPRFYRRRRYGRRRMRFGLRRLRRRVWKNTSKLKKLRLPEIKHTNIVKTGASFPANQNSVFTFHFTQPSLGSEDFSRIGSKIFVKNVQIRFMLDRTNITKDKIGNGILLFQLWRLKEHNQGVSPTSYTFGWDDIWLYDEDPDGTGTTGNGGFWPYYKRKETIWDNFDLIHESMFPFNCGSRKMLAASNMDAAASAAPNTSYVPVSLNIRVNREIDYDTPQPYGYLFFTVAAPNFSGTAYDPFVADQSRGDNGAVYMNMFFTDA